MTPRYIARCSELNNCERTQLFPTCRARLAVTDESGAGPSPPTYGDTVPRCMTTLRTTHELSQ
jgi:hypothetical protein